MTRAALVSVIVPCFNVGRSVHRLLDSILAQKYADIDLILVNDGSTDDTEEIVMSYAADMKKYVRRFSYVFQQNAGLGSAINAGLRLSSGDYLCWPDADDYYEPDSILDRVSILERYTDYAVVTSDAYIRDPERAFEVVGLVSKGYRNNEDERQFELMIRGDSIFCSGTHMVRSSVFNATHPDGQIYPARRGQNWQMLLPIYFGHKRIYLDKPLYNYVRYQASMSRSANTLGERLARLDDHRDILMSTLAKIEMNHSTWRECAAIVDETLLRRQLRIGYEMDAKSLADEARLLLKHHGCWTLRDDFRHVLSRLGAILDRSQPWLRSL